MNTDRGRRQISKNLDEARHVLRQGKNESGLRECDGAQQRLEMEAVGNLDHVGDGGGQPEGAHAVGSGEDSEAVRLQSPERIILAERGEFGFQQGSAALVESCAFQLLQCRFGQVAEGDAAGLHILGLRRRGHIDRNAGVGAGGDESPNFRKRWNIDVQHAANPISEIAWIKQDSVGAAEQN